MWQVFKIFYTAGSNTQCLHSPVESLHTGGDPLSHSPRFGEWSVRGQCWSSSNKVSSTAIAHIAEYYLSVADTRNCCSADIVNNFIFQILYFSLPWLTRIRLTCFLCGCSPTAQGEPTLILSPLFHSLVQCIPQLCHQLYICVKTD